MSLLPRFTDFLRRPGGRERAQAERIAAWQRLPAPALDQPHAATRYVVVDTETSGMDIRSDRLIAIGAAGIDRGELRLDDVFTVVLRQPRPSEADNILVHRIGGEAQLAGGDPQDVLVDFLEFAGHGPLMAFHADFDRAMVERALKRFLGLRLGLPWIDLALVLPALYPGTACGRLDDWLAHFGIDVIERHDPLADAWATAELLLIALGAAERRNLKTARDLMSTQKAQRWLRTRR